MTAVLFAAAVAASGPPPAGVAAASPPAFVQQVSQHSSRSVSISVTPPSNITTGNRLIVLVGVWNFSNPTTRSVTDSAGNPYTELLHFAASDGTEQSVWSAPITSGGTRPSITATPSSNADLGIVALEYAGLSSISGIGAVDQQAHASGTTGSATTVRSGATSATAASELAVGFYVDSGFGDSLSGDTAYTVRTNVSPTGDMELLVEDAIVAAGATPNAGAGTGANTSWLMTTIVFKAASSGPPTVPSAPTGVTATAGNASAAVAWTAPPDGGSPITTYTVTPYIGSTPQAATTVSGSPPPTSVSVSGLTNGTTYTFTVFATNAIGAGPPSAASNGVTPTAAQPPGPTIDASTPVITAATNNVTSVTSGSFSPPAGSIIDAAFSMDSNPTDVNARVASVTNSGAALTWHLKGGENHVASDVGGFVEVWWAYNPTAQTNITVTGNFAQPTKNVTPPVGALEVIVLRNAAADQSSAAWTAAWNVNSSTAPSATVTTTAPNSLVFAVTDNWDSSVAPTVPPNQTTTINGSAAVVLNPTDQDTYWVQAQNAPTAVPGPVTMNDTAPAVRYHTIAWEVLAGSPTIPGGQWSSVLSWPIVAIHSVLLKNGNVLVWDGWQQPEPTQVWNPSTQTFATIGSPDSIFCSGITQLPDGRVIEAGGYGGLTTKNLGIVDTTIFDPSTSSWTRVADMHSPRWYPDLVELADGRYVAISGNSTSAGAWAETPEVYDPATNTWSVLTGISTSQVHEEEYPFSYLAPNGKVFTIGPSEDLSLFLDAANRSWTSVGGASGILNGSSVMYRPGKILYSGGAPSVVNITPATSNTAVIDLTASTPAWRQTAVMANARVYHTLTMLADGTVLAVGGEQTSDQAIVFSGQLSAEIWNPASETWSTVASMAAARNYHSTALLMPDGRVLVAGGGHSNALTDAGQFSAQIYSPPYLFQGPRPTISAAPTGTTYNSSISVSTPDASTIGTVNLVSLGADTHQADMNQHFVPLSFTTGSGALNVQMPGSAALAPPGNYMLFIVNGNGVPSVASFIHLDASPTAPPGPPTNVTAVAGNAQATVSWTPPASNGGSAITGFTVTSSPGGVTASAGASATSAIVSPLVNGTTYTFTVTATNAVGTSGPSPPSNAVTPTAPTAPGPPTNVSAVAGNAQATVSWTPPASNGGSAITGFTVTSSPGGVTASAGASATNAVVSPLVNGTTYTFTVRATNAIGTSSPSAPSNAVTPSAPTAPGPPTNVTAVAGNAQATVSWTPPASNGGSAITGFTVTSSPGGVTASAGASATSAVVSPLVNGTSYTFTVRATNAIGTSSPSAPSNAVTPSAPTVAFVQQVSGHSFSTASISVTPAANIATGNRIIVLVGIWNYGNPTTRSVTDSAGNTYTELLHFVASDGTEQSVWSAPITRGGGTRPTITATPTANADLGIVVLEYAGLSSASGIGAIDQQVHTSGTTGSAAATVGSGATPATTAANELAVGFYVDSGFGDTLSYGSGFTGRANVSPTGDMELLVEDRIVAAGSTPNAIAGTGANTTWLMATVVFKAGL